MRAQVIEAFGEPDVFRIATLPDPRPGSGEVVVALAAASVNPVDDKVSAPVTRRVRVCQPAGASPDRVLMSR